MKVLTSVVAVGVFCGWVANAGAELANAIQAVVDASVITYQELAMRNELTYDRLVQLYRSQPDVLERELTKTRDENLEKLVQDQLILHEFKTAGYNVPESVLEDVVQEHIRDSQYRDRATLTKSLQEDGRTYEKWRQQVIDQWLIRQLRLKNVSQEIIISPHKVANYYSNHRDEWKVEDEVKLRIIELDKTGGQDGTRTHKLAEEIALKLKDGASFEEMAKVYSQGQQRSKGGDWDWVDKKTLRKELSDVAFSLKPGERSGVIETDKACFLMLVEDKRAAHFRSLSEVRDQIEKNLLIDERNRLEKQWLDKLRKKTFVRYF